MNKIMKNNSTALIGLSFLVLIFLFIPTEFTFANVCENPCQGVSNCYFLEFSGWIGLRDHPNNYQTSMTKTINLPFSGIYEVSTCYYENSGSAQLYEEYNVFVNGTNIGHINDINVISYRKENLGQHQFSAGNREVKLEHRWSYNEITSCQKTKSQSIHPKNVVFVFIEPPTVDIKANNSDGPITIAYNTSANLTWTSANANSCVASQDWSGTKAISGSQTTGNLTSAKTYTITCTGPGGSAFDSVTVNVQTSSLSVSLSANPPAGCVPLNNVNLTATISGTAIGPINYRFDCTNNGVWDLEIEGSTESSYTANNLCHYSLPGTYTAKVRVERDQLSAENTTQIEAQDCTPPPTVDIKANNSDGPITIAYNTSANLTWTSTNANSCSASNAWSGTKAISGSQATGNLTSAKTYTITCTGPGGSAFDSVTVNVETSNISVSLSANPPAGCVPLNNVNLTANVSGTAIGNITYYFDCQNDGTWDKIYTTLNNYYTAYNLCFYPAIGTYTAKVRAERGGLFIEDTTPINVYACSVMLPPTVDIKANNSDGPITIAYNTSANLTWTSANANSCSASNAWSGSKAISGSQATGNLTSAQTYTIACTGSGGSASDSVTVNVSPQAPTEQEFSIKKTVRNLSQGTIFSDLVYAEPRDVLTFGIVVQAGSNPLYNVIVKDTLPAGIIYQGDLRINNVLTTGDIFTGLNIGNMAAGEKKTITFRGDVAPAENFSFGQTELINTVSVFTGTASKLDTAKIIVARKAVAGIVTGIPTGLTNNIFLDSFFLPLILSLSAVWLFKSRIINIDEWLGLRKKEYQDYKARKILQLKVAEIKAKEILKEKI